MLSVVIAFAFTGPHKCFQQHPPDSNAISGHCLCIHRPTQVFPTNTFLTAMLYFREYQGHGVAGTCTPVSAAQAFCSRPQAICSRPQAFCSRPQAICSRPQAICSRPQAFCSRPQALRKLSEEVSSSYSQKPICRD